MSSHQAKLAVESRAYPLFRYDPDAGKTPEECFDLEGNPAVDQDWPTYTVKYREDGRDKEMTLPLTFADFAISEIRFRKQFRLAPPDTWNDSMIPLAEFLELDEEDREDRFPYIWTVDKAMRLSRLLVSSTMVESCEDRRDFWTMLRALGGLGKPEVSRADVEREVRSEVAGQIAAGLMQLASGSGAGLAALAQGITMPASAGGTATAEAPAAGDYLAPWIDTPQCTACDECVNINGKIFEYNKDKKAVIKDPLGGPYKDIVKAAERCTARVIHPGLPKDRSPKDIDKWIARGEKFN
jgi:pyruvate-ferredoxin/flavodoxin oxidoreductase